MMIRMGGLGAALLALTLAFSRQVRAAPAKFGDRGQLVLDQRFSVVGTYSHMAYGDAGIRDNLSWISFAPSASYFVLPRLSVGLSASIQTSHFSASTSFHGRTTAVGVTPSIGYALPFAEHFSAWPQLSVSMHTGWSEGTGSPRVTDWGSSLAVPLLWQPAEHFFVGLGPSLEYQLATYYGPIDNGQSIRTWGIGARTTIGGYFSP